MSVRQSCWVLSLHTAAFVHCVFLRHRASISSAALCEENTRCCMWSLILATRCHGNTNQNSSVHKWGRQGERASGLGIGWMGSRHRGAVNVRRWLSSSRLLPACAWAPNELQGEQAMKARKGDRERERGRGKKKKKNFFRGIRGSHWKDRATSNLLHDLSRRKKVTKLKGEALEKVAKQMNLPCDYIFHQRKGQW